MAQNTGYAGSSSGWQPSPTPGTPSFEKDVQDAIQRLSQNVSALQAQGTQVTPSTPAATSGQVYDLTYSIAGKPTAAGTYQAALIGRAIGFPANWTGTQAVANTRATDAAVFSMSKLTGTGGSIPMGTITVLPTGLSVVQAPAATFAPGDRLVLAAPYTQDATMADVYFVFAGNLLQS